MPIGHVYRYTDAWWMSADIVVDAGRYIGVR